MYCWPSHVSYVNVSVLRAGLLSSTVDDLLLRLDDLR